MVELDPSSRRRPPSFTRAGASWRIIDPTTTSAGPCDAIFDSCDAEDRQRRRLLLLPTLRLLRCLLRRCFRPSLLRHCCPPSLSGWRHRYSAVANRPALASAYTSAEKKTAFPLNFVYRFRLAPIRCVCRAIDIPTRRQKLLRRRKLLCKIRNSAEMPMECGFLRYRSARWYCVCTLSAQFTLRLSHALDEAHEVEFAARKIFTLEVSAGTSAPSQRRQNARITLTDSRLIYADGMFGD